MDHAAFLEQISSIGTPVAIDTVLVTKTLYWYDGPLMVFADIAGVLHYGHAIDGGKGWMAYVYVPVDEAMSLAIEGDAVDLRDVLAGAQRALVATLDWFDGSERVTARATTGQALPPDWLPEPRMRLTVAGSLAAGWTPSSDERADPLASH